MFGALQRIMVEDRWYAEKMQNINQLTKMCKEVIGKDYKSRIRNIIFEIFFSEDSVGKFMGFLKDEFDENKLSPDEIKTNKIVMNLCLMRYATFMYNNTINYKDSENISYINSFIYLYTQKFAKYHGFDKVFSNKISIEYNGKKYFIHYKIDGSEILSSMVDKTIAKFENYYEEIYSNYKILKHTDLDPVDMYRACKNIFVDISANNEEYKQEAIAQYEQNLIIQKRQELKKSEARKENGKTKIKPNLVVNEQDKGYEDESENISDISDNIANIYNEEIANNIKSLLGDLVDNTKLQRIIRLICNKKMVSWEYIQKTIPNELSDKFIQILENNNIEIITRQSKKEKSGGKGSQKTISSVSQDIFEEFESEDMSSEGLAKTIVHLGWIDEGRSDYIYSILAKLSKKQLYKIDQTILGHKSFEHKGHHKSGGAILAINISSTDRLLFAQNDILHFEGPKGHNDYMSYLEQNTKYRG